MSHKKAQKAQRKRFIHFVVYVLFNASKATICLVVYLKVLLVFV